MGRIGTVEETSPHLFTKCDTPVEIKEEEIKEEEIKETEPEWLKNIKPKAKIEEE